MNHQQTISQPVEIQGRGLFTGEPSTLRFVPAPPNSGITFVRNDQPTPIRIPATVENVAKRARRTAIRNGTVAIETVEHCLSALAGVGIDNVDVEVNANELPAMDGSSQPFVEALISAGLEPQATERKIVRIDELIRVSDGDAELVAFPALGNDLNIIYDLDYGPDSPIGHQVYTFRLGHDDFATQIAPARTFVLEEEANQLRASGLGKHLNFSDILVFGANGPIENEVRFPEECVRHKILDLVGDLMLLGRFVSGRILARKSGHALNHELVREIRKMLDAQARGGLLVSKPVLDVRHLQRILPHRYPFLMIDRVVEIQVGRRAIGIKNVTANEEFFQGHYPGEPIMPGVLIIEAMAQIGGVLLGQELEHRGKVAVLLSLDKVKFRRAVTPGDQLILKAEAIRIKTRTGHTRCQAMVGDELAAEAEIKFMLVDAEPL